MLALIPPFTIAIGQVVTIFSFLSGTVPTQTIALQASLSVVSVFVLNYLVTHRFRPLLFTFYFVLIGSWWVLSTPIDYPLIRDNLGLLKSTVSWATIWQQSWPWLILLPIVYLLAVAVSKTKKPFYKKRALLLTLGYLGLLRLHSVNGDTTIGFIMSTWRYYQDDRFYPPDAVKQFPLIKNESSLNANQPSPNIKPHVFIVLMESMNARFIGTKNNDGIEYTPVLNRLMHNAISTERFYGNSVQTANGHLATLCGVIPTGWGKVMTDYEHVNLQCLPALLREQGYRTYFLQASADLGFDNTGKFMHKIGFQIVAGEGGRSKYDPSKEFKEPPKDPNIWGWGIEDKEFYKRAFAELDQVDQTKPLFVTLATIMNHWGFDQIPNASRKIYPNPQSQSEWYANSIHLADEQLSYFFQELAKRPNFQNSIVLLIGDHSFPAGEHDNYMNSTKAYEENFRTLFALLTPRELTVLNDTTARQSNPTRQQIIRGSWSQVDIAPTILRLLNLQVRHHFFGSAMPIDESQPVSTEKFVHLVQPYDGKYLAVVKYPYKLVKHMRSKRYVAFDLAADPNESHDIWPNLLANEKSLAAELRDQIGWHFLNQKLFDENRVWKD